MLPRRKTALAEPEQGDATPPAKKPWQTPHVRSGHLFESNSLACGKSTPQLEQCNQNPATS